MLKKRYKNEYGKRGICVLAFTALAVLAMSGTALAAGWSMESGSWHYINYDGSYATDCFKRSGDNYFYLDSSGERLTYKFEKSGRLRGSGVNGIDGDAIYVNGRRMEADPDMRYEIYEYDGESYLISSSGKIMKNRTNIKDGDGYYYCTDKKRHSHLSG